MTLHFLWCLVQQVDWNTPIQPLTFCRWLGILLRICLPLLADRQIKIQSERPVLSPFISYGSLQSQITFFCMKAAKMQHRLFML